VEHWASQNVSACDGRVIGHPLISRNVTIAITPTYEKRVKEAKYHYAMHVFFAEN